MKFLIVLLCICQVYGQNNIDVEVLKIIQKSFDDLSTVSEILKKRSEESAAPNSINIGDTLTFRLFDKFNNKFVSGVLKTYLQEEPALADALNLQIKYFELLRQSIRYLAIFGGYPEKTVVDYISSIAFNKVVNVLYKQAVKKYTGLKKLNLKNPRLSTTRFQRKLKKNPERNLLEVVGQADTNLYKILKAKDSVKAVLKQKPVQLFDRVSTVVFLFANDLLNFEELPVELRNPAFQLVGSTFNSIAIILKSLNNGPPELNLFDQITYDLSLSVQTEVVDALLLFSGYE